MTEQTLTATITAVEESKFVLITPIKTSSLLFEDEVEFELVKFAVEQNFDYKFLEPLKSSPSFSFASLNKSSVP